MWLQRVKHSWSNLAQYRFIRKLILTSREFLAPLRFPPLILSYLHFLALSTTLKSFSNYSPAHNSLSPKFFTFHLFSSMKFTLIYLGKTLRITKYRFYVESFSFLIYLFLATLGLCCSAQTLSSCEWGLFSSCSVWASHCSGFSCCRAWAP